MSSSMDFKVVNKEKVLFDDWFSTSPARFAAEIMNDTDYSANMSDVSYDTMVEVYKQVNARFIKDLASEVQSIQVKADAAAYMVDKFFDIGDYERAERAARDKFAYEAIANNLRAWQFNDSDGYDYYNNLVMLYNLVEMLQKMVVVMRDNPDAVASIDFQ